MVPRWGELKPVIHKIDVGLAIQLLAAAGASSAVCAALRIKLVYYPVASISDALSIAKVGLRLSYFDMLLICSIAAACITLITVTTRSGVVITAAYLGFSSLCVFFSCINVLAILYIGGALTFQWIYYAD